MITLKQSDLEELRKSYYFLSDVIMEFYFNYLSSIYPSDSILFVPPAVSFLAANSVDAKDVRDCLKPLELPAKGLILFPVNNGGTHWSLLVYHRKLNVFAHHDSMNGLNNFHAKELYFAVKRFVHKFRVFRSKRKHVDMDSPSDDPPIYHVRTPQQGNGFDCGLYVMAMAEVICQWYCSEEVGKHQNWIKDLCEKVNSSLEKSMRHQVLELIYEASVGRLGSVLCTIEERIVVSSDSDISGLSESGSGSDVEDDCSGMEDDDAAPNFIGPLTEEESARAENDCGTMSRGMREDARKYPRICGRPRGLLLLEGKKDADLEPTVVSRCGTTPLLSTIMDHGLKGKEVADSEPLVARHCGTRPSFYNTKDCRTLESYASDCGMQEPYVSVSGSDSTQTASSTVEDDLGANHSGTLEASASCSTIEEDKPASDCETALVTQSAEEGVNDLEPVEQGYYDMDREGTNHTCATTSPQQKAAGYCETSEEPSGLGNQEAPNDYQTLEPKVEPLNSYSPTLSSSFSILEGENAVNDFGHHQPPLLVEK